MKGYKATHNMKCLDFLFEVGKTYEIEGELKICKNGFHFCRKMEDTTDYYDPTDNFILLEIEALGDIQHKDDKSVTSRIKILRVVPKEEYTFKTWEYEWDNKGNKISETDPNGHKYFYEYNDLNNMISMTDSDGDKWSYEYDDRNNRISETSPSGDKWSYEYDDRNNKISETSPSGDKWSYEYDDRNNKISMTSPNGDKWSYEYDDRNNMISMTSPSGYKYTY